MTANTTDDATITTPADREILVERIFDAPRERVWAAFSRLEQLVQWWSGGDLFAVERWEFRKGGHYRFLDRYDGEINGFEGRFREITPQERIVQTFEWDGMPGHVAVDAVTFTDLGDGRTKVTTLRQFHTPEERDGMLHSGMAKGMNASYRALDTLLTRSA
ncbi:SRPBCC family protein [Nocardia bovistercoris]|uniref:SRPBCC family protein n=1 Tax=Nocardia bovistercoris TaxID=2785916 RepID=A0A931IJU9_9NOCA|nr:SRPBCC family protein [Nocardia bovistercoris]MBH0780985.1 SRPBCC family protein [Nocardia bovistercoris]